MHFTKYHGLGNDFIFLDAPVAQTLTDPFTAARQLCNRRTGIGADGLILLLPSVQADVRMRIINSDGSEAEMCGNASRCVPLHLVKKGFTTKTHITLETLAGLIETDVLDLQKGLVRVNMGTPRYTRGALPMTGDASSLAVNTQIEVAGQTFTGTGVSMGNPHFVIEVADVEHFPVEKIGPLIETSSFFPRKTNVEFIQVLDEKNVRMRVWERGAGITQACGTGACATATACVLTHRTASEVAIHLDGGDLHISWPSQKEIYMTGPAQYVFEGEIPL